jgi:hypothetical protein
MLCCRFGRQISADYTRTTKSYETARAVPGFKPSSARVPAATNQACDYTKRPEVTPASTGSPPEEKRFLADAIVSQWRIHRESTRDRN